MAHILINDTKFSLDTAKDFERVLSVVATYGITFTVLDDDSGEPTGETVDVDFDPKAIALASELGCSPLTVSECRYGDDMYESSEDPGEYRVLTESERDTAWDEALESYIDDCIFTEATDKTLKQYFDREAWKRDARHDGAGHALSSYDGAERGAQVGGEYYFIYRVN